MKILFCFISFFLLLKEQIVFSQHFSSLNNDVVFRQAEKFYTSNNYHTAIKPYIIKEFEISQIIDSSLCSQSKKKVLANNLFEKKVKFLNLSLSPVLNEFYLIGAGNKSFLNHSAGARLKATFNEKHGFYIAYNYSNYNYFDYLKTRIDSTNIIPHFGDYLLDSAKRYIYNDFNFYWNYKAGKHLNINAGNGKHFFGDGHRSLLLSDNSKSYPYVRLDVDIWKFKYVVLYSFLKDINYPDAAFRLEKKYSTSHLLSYNITNNIHVGLFESVVWNGGATSGFRGYEINYLNPIIFFRPVEFSLNDPSPDNVLLGAFYRFNFGKFIHYYGQLILDDFNFTEFKKQTGYWGNKYGLQQGFWYFNAFNVKNLQLQTEFNIVSPFTYSHTTSLDNYGHYFQALAHPLGANFVELIAATQYYINRFGFTSKFISAKTGINKNGNISGQNIYDSYTSRNSDDGFSILNGEKVRYQIFESKVSYILNPEWLLQFEMGFTYRIKKSPTENQANTFFAAGFRSLINNETVDY